MAANLLGLFFLIIGIAGVSDAFSLKEFFHRNKRSYPNWRADSFDINGFKRRSEALCRYKFGPFACRNVVYDPPYFRLETNDMEKHYPRWQNPYFRHGFAESDSFENPFYKVIYDPYESSAENINEDDHSVERHVNNEQKVSNYIRTQSPLPSSGNPTQSDAYSKSNTPFRSSDGSNFAQSLYVTGQKLSNFKFFPASNQYSQVKKTTSNYEISEMIHMTPVEQPSSFVDEKNVDMVGVKNTFPNLEMSSKGIAVESSMGNKDLESTSEYLRNIFEKDIRTAGSFTGKRKGRTNGLTFPITPSLTTAETKGFPPKETTSLKERLDKSVEGNLQTESKLNQGYTKIYSIINGEAIPLTDKSSSSDGTDTVQNHVSQMFPNFRRTSTVFQNPFSGIREVTYLNNKSNSPNGIQSKIEKGYKLEPTASESFSSIIMNKEIFLNTKSSSLEKIYSVSTEKFDTKSDISLNSSTMTNDGTSSKAKLGSSFVTQSATAEILEMGSTTENSISSNKVTAIPVTDKVKEDSWKETFSTKSPSWKIHFKPEEISQDHIIEIPSIRTARIVITTVFLVIALTALTILAVYMFRLRRREVQYDQLMLIR